MSFMTGENSHYLKSPFAIGQNALGASMENLQAVALALDNTSFAEIEKLLELHPGTVTGWAKDFDTPFATLVAEMRDEIRDADES